MRLRDPDGIDAEADFLVADPARGILIIEVKGGRIEERNGTWYSNGKPIIPAPREQAHRFLRGLIELCRSRNVGLPGCGIVTCFPDTAFDRGPTQADMAGCVLGAQDLHWLDRALQSLWIALSRAVTGLAGSGWTRFTRSGVKRGSPRWISG